MRHKIHWVVWTVQCTQAAFRLLKVGLSHRYVQRSDFFLVHSAKYNELFELYNACKLHFGCRNLSWDTVTCSVPYSGLFELCNACKLHFDSHKLSWAIVRYEESSFSIMRTFPKYIELFELYASRASASESWLEPSSGGTKPFGSKKLPRAIGACDVKFTELH